MKSEFQEQLKKLALKRSTAFCYGCYVKAPEGVCPQCHSDDLMRLLEGVGCDYGTSWMIDHILAEELEAVDLEEAFEEMIRSCYPEEVTIGWANFDTAGALKSLDPVGWRCAISDYESEEECEGNIISFDNGSTYYRSNDLKNLLARQ